jgi:hypothetical protein
MSKLSAVQATWRVEGPWACASLFFTQALSVCEWFFTYLRWWGRVTECRGGGDECEGGGWLKA